MPFSCQEYFCTFFRFAPVLIPFYALFSLSFRPVTPPSPRFFRQSLCGRLRAPIQLVGTFLSLSSAAARPRRRVHKFSKRPDVAVDSKVSDAPIPTAKAAATRALPNKRNRRSALGTQIVQLRGATHGGERSEIQRRLSLPRPGAPAPEYQVHSMTTSTSQHSWLQGVPDYAYSRENTRCDSPLITRDVPIVSSPAIHYLFLIEGEPPHADAR
jgi:hypothetical protein